MCFIFPPRDFFTQHKSHLTTNGLLLSESSNYSTRVSGNIFPLFFSLIASLDHCEQLFASGLINHSLRKVVRLVLKGVPAEGFFGRKSNSFASLWAEK